MPSKKKKYNARFPAGRIKKIMQTDEDVGKVAQAVPIIIYDILPRTLELFVESLLTKTMQITSAKNAKTLSPSHMKQCILSESCFDFLKDLVKGLPDVSCPDDDVPTPPLTPAPQTAHLQPNSVIYPPAITRQDSVGIVKEVGSSATIIGNTCQNSRDQNRGAGLQGATSQTAAPAVTPNEINRNRSTTTTSLQSSFQTTLSTSFNASQPNFYTELNPINLSTNSNSVNVNIKPTTNYTSSTSIDEDYDT